MLSFVLHKVIYSVGAEAVVFLHKQMRVWEVYIIINLIYLKISMFNDPEIFLYEPVILKH